MRPQLSTLRDDARTRPAARPEALHARTLRANCQLSASCSRFSHLGRSMQFQMPELEHGNLNRVSAGRADFRWFA